MPRRRLGSPRPPPLARRADGPVGREVRRSALILAGALTRDAGCQQNLEGYLKRLVVAQLRAGDLLEGQDNLNKLMIHGRNTEYLDMLHLLNEAIAAGSHEASTRTCQTIIQFLDSGIRGNTDSRPGSGLALGVSEFGPGTGSRCTPTRIHPRRIHLITLSKTEDPWLCMRERYCLVRCGKAKQAGKSMSSRRSTENFSHPMPVCGTSTRRTLRVSEKSKCSRRTLEKR
jgi:hypothetical protein